MHRNRIVSVLAIAAFAGVLMTAACASAATRPPAGAGATSAGSAGGLPGARSPAAGPILPVTSCASLAHMNFTGVPDARGKITSSTVVSDPLPAGPASFCDVKGVFAPQTQFEMKLPAATWHGQYVQEGCEAYCGTLTQLSDFPDAGFTCTAAGNGELALATDDEGHTSSSLTDGRWAKNSCGSCSA